jgi:hypothetical protein
MAAKIEAAKMKMAAGEIIESGGMNEMAKMANGEESENMKAASKISAASKPERNGEK